MRSEKRVMELTRDTCGRHDYPPLKLAVSNNLAGERGDFVEQRRSRLGDDLSVC